VRRRIILVIGLLAAFLALTAADCIVVTKQAELPVRDDESFLFRAQGGPETTGSYPVDFGPSLDALEEEHDFVALLRAVVEAGFWRVASNNGDPDLVISGTITVTRLNPAPGVRDVAQTALLMAYQPVTIASVIGAFQPAPLEEAGLDLLTEGFDEYLQARAQNLPLPDMKYRFVWTGTANGSGSDVDFTWEGKVKFTLVGLVQADVPDVWH